MRTLFTEPQEVLGWNNKMTKQQTKVTQIVLAASPAVAVSYVMWLFGQHAADIRAYGLLHAAVLNAREWLLSLFPFYCLGAIVGTILVFRFLRKSGR